MNAAQEPDVCILPLRCEDCDDNPKQEVLQFLETADEGHTARLTKLECMDCGRINKLRLRVQDRDCSECGHETVHIRKRTITGVVRGLFQYNTKWYCSVCGERWSEE